MEPAISCCVPHRHELARVNRQGRVLRFGRLLKECRLRRCVGDVHVVTAREERKFSGAFPVERSSGAAATHLSQVHDVVSRVVFGKRPALILIEVDIVHRFDHLFGLRSLQFVKS